MIRPNLRAPHLLIWLSLSIAIGSTAAWVLAHGYLNENALFRWAQISSVLDAPEFRLENLGLLYPHVPLYLLIPFYFLPGLATPFAPYLASSLIGALLLMLWHYHLRLRRCPPATALLLVLLVAVHPMFLWAATSGTEKALSLLVFYLMCSACVRLLRIGDVRSIILLGCILALYFFIDERTVFLFLALLPLLPFLTPMRMLQTSMASAYVLISLPIVIAVLAWIYLNWLFHGNPWLFLTSFESSFAGASRTVQDIAWLRQFGGEFFFAFGWITILAAIALPVLAWTLWHLRSRPRLLLGMGILASHPILAAAIATKAYFLDHPINLIFLMLAACMASLLLLPKAWTKRGMVPVGWFFATALGGWIAFSLAPNDEMRQWRDALGGTPQGNAYAADARTGQWLAANRRITLIDSRAAYRVVAARGDSHGLWLPFMLEFRLAERSGDIHADQVVVIDPRHRLAPRDRITQRFPHLYEKGQIGYELALDDPPWRVYRRANMSLAY